MLLSILLAQAIASPSPAVTSCPPTQVTRIKPTPGPGVPPGDPEWHGPLRSIRECTGIQCYVEQVLVTVNPDGSIKSAVVAKPWDYGADYAALTAAKSSKYIPASWNCKAVEGTYIFREMFTTHTDPEP